MLTTHMGTACSCIPHILILFQTLNTIGSPIYCEQKKTTTPILFWYVEPKVYWLGAVIRHDHMLLNGITSKS